MLPLLLALLLLAVAFRLLLRPRARSVAPSADKPGDSGLSTVQRKLLEEAFEHSPSPDALDTNATPPLPVLILYATEYGFACQVARTVAAALTAAPTDGDAPPPVLNPRVVNVLHYNVVDFTRESVVALVCSTTGDGVPPNEATAFRDALVATDVVLPPASRFAVLALGDRAYLHFCRAGAIFDALLPESARLLPRVDVDQEDWDVINDWTNSLCDAIASHLASPLAPVPPPTDYLRAAIDKYSASLNAIDAQYTLNNPFDATVLSRRSLTGPVSKPGHKNVLRVEFDVSDSGLQYQVGDSLAVIPRNNPEHVDRLLRTIASNGDEFVHLSESSATSQPIRFDDALTEALDLNTVRPQLIAFLARHSGSASEVQSARRVLGHDPRDPSVRSHSTVTGFGKKYLAEREVNDVLMDFADASITAQQLVNVMRPLHARYYSISSTPVTAPDRIAVTVDVLRYMTLNVEREGVASTFLHDRCRIGDTKAGIFLSKNPNFRLPVDDATPIIMIGPGTGIAPFMAFLEERDAKNSTGENWLFSGCRFERQDFLYGVELRKYAARGFLRLQTAFSRDGPEKVYVQKRLTECSKQVWSLIHEQGAHVYVCGDGGSMATSVDEVLQKIAELQGEMSTCDAILYLEKLSAAKRYQRDVWVS